jgi:hypothetical protein
MIFWVMPGEDLQRTARIVANSGVAFMLQHLFIGLIN